jgi:hypothetical protein
MKRASVVLCLLALLAVPAVADTIFGGIDTWVTKPDGKTLRDFSRHPLPAGFFCEGSAPFTGRIAFRGVPIASDNPGLLGETDTIVERMDNATFDEAGVATTRVRLRALQMVSIAPVRTSCGSFNVRVSLDGSQPVTRMRIFREGEDGGRFLAPLALRARLTFSPVSGRGREIEIVRDVRFDANPRNRWSQRPVEAGQKAARTVKIDTDGDLIPDTVLRGPSNFAAGLTADQKRLTQDESVIGNREAPEDPNCHLGQDDFHCPSPGGGYYIY